MSVHKIKLNICGTEFITTTEKTEAEALEAAAAVEECIKSLSTDNNRVSTTLASIITALDFYDKVKDSENKAKNALEQAEEYKKETLKMQEETERMREELRMVRLKLKSETITKIGADPKPSVGVVQNQLSFSSVKASTGKYIRPTLDDIVPEQERLQTFFAKDPDSDVENKQFEFYQLSRIWPLLRTTGNIKLKSFQFYNVENFKKMLKTF